MPVGRRGTVWFGIALMDEHHQQLSCMVPSVSVGLGATVWSSRLLARNSLVQKELWYLCTHCKKKLS